MEHLHEQLPNGKKDKVLLVSGSSHPDLADDIAASMGLERGVSNPKEFPSGELHVRLQDNARGRHVVIVQSHVTEEGFSINDSIVEQVLLIDAARRASAKSITAVMPMFGYGRQDRKAEGREPISAKAIVRMLDKAGPRRFVSMDMHVDAIAGFTEKPFDHLSARYLLCDWMREEVARRSGEDFMLVAPDAGRTKLAEEHAKELQLPYDFMPKTRLKGDSSKLAPRRKLDGVAGRICLVNDDMIDTAGTLVSAGEALKEAGAKEVIALATHGIFSGPALERLASTAIDKVVVTDTLPPKRAREALGDKLEVITVAQTIGDTLVRVLTKRSVSDLMSYQKTT